MKKDHKMLFVTSQHLIELLSVYANINIFNL